MKRLLVLRAHLFQGLETLVHLDSALHPSPRGACTNHHILPMREAERQEPPPPAPAPAAPALPRDGSKAGCSQLVGISRSGPFPAST